MVETSDEELMKAYAVGNKEAFSVLYDRFEGRIFQFLKNRLPSKHRTILPDLFQLTWYKVHKSRASFDANQKFSTWLFSIAINTLRDYIGEARHKKELELESASSSEMGSVHIEDELIARLDRNSIQLLLNRLPIRLKEVLLLADGEGFEPKEIGEILGLSMGATRQLLYRARKEIQAVFKEGSWKR